MNEKPVTVRCRESKNACNTVAEYAIEMA